MHGKGPGVVLSLRYHVLNNWIGTTADARVAPVQVTIEHIDIKIKLEVLVPF